MLGASAICQGKFIPDSKHKFMSYRILSGTVVTSDPPGLLLRDIFVPKWRVNNA